MLSRIKKHIGRVAGLCSRLLVLTAVLLAGWQGSASADVTGFRYSAGPTKVRLVFDLDKPAAFRVPGDDGKTLKDSLDILLDTGAGKKVVPAVKDPLVKSIGLERGKKDCGIRLSLDRPVQYKVFTLKGPDRLVVDLYRIAIIRTEKDLGGGLRYTFWQDDMNGHPVQLHILSLAPGSAYELRPFSGKPGSTGRGKLQEIATGLGAKAAINACYFDMAGGWIIGNCKWDGVFHGTETIPRSAFVVDEKGKPMVLQDLSYTGEIEFPREIPGQRVWPVTGVNRPRLENDLVVYNGEHGMSTGTNEFGFEVKLVEKKAENPAEKKRSSRKAARKKAEAVNAEAAPGVWTGTVTERSDKGNMTLLPGTLVLSGYGKNAAAIKMLQIGDMITMRESLGNPVADRARFVLGAGPSLLTAGKVDVRAVRERMAPDIARGRAPRTAVGVKADGTVLLLVVDGRSELSHGMTLTELAAYLQHLGAVQAVNFDGGGSSEMVLDGNILNRPSGGKERPVSVGLGVFPRG